MTTLVGGYDPEQHGVTVSQLSDWLDCREKARYRLLGVRPRVTKLAQTYGTTVHELLERMHEGIRVGKLKTAPSKETVIKAIDEFDQTWRKANPRASADTLEQLELSVHFARAVMPNYFKHWKHDLFKMKWLAVEREFTVPFKLPDGTTVPFRGWRDGVYELGKKLWLFESKSKSRVDEGALVDRLPFELQLVSYLLSLWEELGRKPRGALYNIVRRPQLRQKKKESFPTFINRVATDVVKRPEFYFQQFEIICDDLEEQREPFLNLMQDYVNWCRGKTGHYRSSEHCENKYGTCLFLPLCANRTTHLYENTQRLFKSIKTKRRTRQ